MVKHLAANSTLINDIEVATMK